jgi:hypothetical protein
VEATKDAVFFKRKQDEEVEQENQEMASVVECVDLDDELYGACFFKLQIIQILNFLSLKYMVFHN